MVPLQRSIFPSLTLFLQSHRHMDSTAVICGYLLTDIGSRSHLLNGFLTVFVQERSTSDGTARLEQFIIQTVLALRKPHTYGSLRVSPTVSSERFHCAEVCFLATASPLSSRSLTCYSDSMLASLRKLLRKESCPETCLRRRSLIS